MDIYIKIGEDLFIPSGWDSRHIADIFNNHPDFEGWNISWMNSLLQLMLAGF